MVKRSSLGRQKIAIEKISKKNHLQVTFSKRRSGLFKKASELSTLCGVEIGIIVFSPANKAFSFGHPAVDSIVDRFLAQNPLPNSNADKLIKAHRNANVNELNMQLTHVLNQLEAEKKQAETLNQMKKSSQKLCWWENPIDELDLHQLKQLKDALEELKKNVKEQASRILIQSSNPSPFLAGNVSNYESKLNVINDASSFVPHVNNFGYKHGIFSDFLHLYDGRVTN